MIAPLNSRYLPYAQSALRIAAGLTYFSHGAPKLFGLFGGVGPDHGMAHLLTRFGAAGVIEVVCGAMLILGLATRFFAFIASGEMAVTYFWMHVGGTGMLFWWQNHGELPLVYCFVWFAFAAWGPGPVSVDAWLAARSKKG